MLEDLLSRPTELSVFLPCFASLSRSVVAVFNCLVFTSKFRPMTEVGGNSVYYLNPYKKIESAKIINTKLKFKKLIIKKGFKNLKRFKLSIISDQYLNFYTKNFQRR